MGKLNEFDAHAFLAARAHATVNIGLDASDKRGKVSAAQVLAFLMARVRVIAWRISNAGAERTLIVQVDAPLTIAQAHTVCNLFDQDCVAQSTNNGATGELIGPRAAAWGAFDSRYFQAINASDLRLRA